MHVGRRLRNRLLGTMGVLLVAAPILLALVAAPATMAADISSNATATSSADTVSAGQMTPGPAIPGACRIDLTGMDPDLQGEFLQVVAEVAGGYDLEVPYILPADRWNDVTGAPSAGGNMFASDLGIAFNPDFWGAEQSAGTLASLAQSRHAAANGKTFRGLVIHELGHVLLDQRFGIGVQDDRNPARVLVEEYRLARGADEVVPELGSYAWTGSPGRSDQAWQETFAEAFAAYVLDPWSMNPATRTLVERVLAWDRALRLADLLLQPR